MPADRRSIARAALIVLAAAALAAIVAAGRPAESSIPPHLAAYRAAVAADAPVAIGHRAGTRTDLRIAPAARHARVTVVARRATASGAVELWARPRGGRTGGLTLRWGATRLPLRSSLSSQRWTHVLVSWSTGRTARVYLDGRLSETYSFADHGRATPRALVLRGLDRAADLLEPRAYAHALTARAAARHFAAGAAMAGRELAARPAPGRAVAHAATAITADTPPAIGGDAVDGSWLSATTGTWDATEPIDYAYQWLRCDEDGEDCAEVDGATGDSYLLSSEDVGATLRVRVSATSPDGDGASTSDPTGVVDPLAPGAIAPPVVDGETVATKTLTATTGVWTGTVPMDFTYQWRRCDEDGDDCADISGATADHYVLDEADVDARIRVAVTATNAAGSDAATADATAQVTPVEAPARLTAPAVDGEPTVGATLTTDDGSWSGTTPLDVTRQWQRCDVYGGACADIEDATAAGYTLTAGDEGHTIRVAVAVANPAGTSGGVSALTEAVVMAPASVTAPAIAGAAADGTRLTADRGAWDGTRPLATSYQWQRCDTDGEDCTGITDATTSAYVLAPDDIGATVRVSVTVHNDAGEATVASEPTAVVVASAPHAESTPLARGTAQVGGTFHARVGRWSGTPGISYAYTWSLCDEHGAGCVAMSGATDDALAVTEDLTGQTVRVTVEATNAVGSATATSPPTKVVGVFGATITGVARVAETLEAVPDELLGEDPDFAYQWQRCEADGTGCADISGEHGHSYTLVAGDEGSTLRVRVTATLGEDEDDVSGVSSVTEPVVARIPVNEEPPVIAGQAVVGLTLTATPGAWEHEGTPTYQWARCAAAGDPCVAIAGDDGTDHEVVPDDLGSRLRVTMTETSTGGAESVDSALTDVVVARPLVNTVAPVVTRGAGPDGDLLTATPGTWAGAGTITYTYAWEACDAGGTTCTPVAGATRASYPLRAADVGQRLRVVVRAHNSAGSESASSAVTGTLAASPVAAVDAGAIAGTAQAGESLIASGATWTGIGPLSIVYQWQRCDALGTGCHDLDGEDGSSYVAVDDDAGGTLRVVLTAGNAGGTATATTAVTTVVAAADAPAPAPEATTPPSISGTVAAGETLTAATGTWTGIGTLTYSYQWRRCDAAGGDCVDIPGEVGTTYAAGSGDVGHALSVLVVATDALATGTGAATATTATSVRAVGGPESDTAPIVSGTARDGETLSATDGTWSDDDGTPSYAIRWQRCDAGGTCVDIQDDADASTYELTDDDVDQQVRAVVTATDADENATTVVSASTAVVVPAMPILRTEPSVAGTTDTGETLHADPGDWDGLPTITYAYQWQRCDVGGEDCADISGATSGDYVLDAADAGATVRVTVIATNAAGSGDARSDASAPVSASAGPSLSAAPRSPAPSRENETVTADHGTWSGSGTITYTYRWLRCDDEGGGCAAVAGASDDTLA